MRLSVCWGLCWALYAVLAGTAHPAMAGPKPHEHDGFFLRFQPGFGINAAWTDNPSLFVGGTAGQLDLDIGGTVARNLVVFGKVFGNRASRPNMEVNGVQVPSDGYEGVYGGIGAGVSYYLPEEFFVTGAFSVARLDLRSAKYDLDSAFGPTLHLGLGKQWWVSDNWALGVSLELLGGFYPDSDRNARWRAGSGLVQFSATYN